MSALIKTALKNFSLEASGGNGNYSDELLMTEAGYIAAAVTLFLIGFFGFFLNLFVIVLMWKDKQLWTPLNIILFNLVCSEFSVSILGNPWTLVSALSHRWIFGRTMCIMYGFFMSLLGITSITTLTVLAFERYVMVSQPFRSRNLSRNGAVYMVVGIWIYSVCLTTPPLFGWGKYVNEAANISCSVNWEEQTLNSMTYILFLFAFGLFVPLVVITFSYANIIATMKQNNVRMGRVTKAEGRVAYMVLLMIIAFLVAWSPYAILALLIQFGDPSMVTPAMGVFPALLAKSSICYNPIIYVGLNTQFRQSWKQLKRKNAGFTDHSMDTAAMALSKMVSQDALDTDSRKKLIKHLSKDMNNKPVEMNMLMVKSYRDRQKYVGNSAEEINFRMDNNGSMKNDDTNV